MIHPHTEIRFINDQVGHGVVATQFIPAGTITWALDKLDREFTPSDFKQLDILYQNILETYTYRNKSGNLVLCWDNGRFVNHSFKSNCLSTAYDFEIAICDIHPGEQLTDDYGYLNVTEPFTGIDEGTERKTVFPDDLLKYSNVWDAQVKAVFSEITKVNQPLKNLISSSTWKTIEDIISHKKEMASIAENYYNPHVSVTI
ncbi:SET domain-containing protein [Leeuwenhoekiella sp. MAR_2009_132]|uniref:SET domain-containing protein n=1 Tax=Leeuwenhoekiella sp. MAR_2009_132 TaxID=1392489 RepID=UPI00048C0EE9|nr:SET domain-containing protein [Leeuwenhoekiella sp. MAR_2009_132]